MTRDELIERAAAIDLKVDGRWSDETLQEEIAKKEAEMVPPEPPMIVAAEPAPARDAHGGTPIRLLYDTWFQEDQRTPAGKVVHVDIETAKRLIGSGKAERADPLPGEA